MMFPIYIPPDVAPNAYRPPLYKVEFGVDGGRVTRECYSDSLDAVHHLKPEGWIRYNYSLIKGNPKYSKDFLYNKKTREWMRWTKCSLI